MIAEEIPFEQPHYNKSNTCNKQQRLIFEVKLVNAAEMRTERTAGGVSSVPQCHQHHSFSDLLEERKLGLHIQLF